MAQSFALKKNYRGNHDWNNQEQVRKGGKDISVGRTSWEGGQRKALIKIDPERTPAEIHFVAAKISNATKRGRARS